MFFKKTPTISTTELENKLGSIINSVGWWIPYVRFTTHIE